MKYLIKYPGELLTLGYVFPLVTPPALTPTVTCNVPISTNAIPKNMKKKTIISNLEVLEFTRGTDIATVVTNGTRVNCYEPNAFGSYVSLIKAIAHLEGNGWSILIR